MARQTEVKQCLDHVTALVSVKSPWPDRQSQSQSFGQCEITMATLTEPKQCLDHVTALVSVISPWPDRQ